MMLKYAFGQFLFGLACPASLLNKLYLKKKSRKQPSTSICCLFRLGLYREAEKQFKSALKQQDMVDTILYLAKVSHQFAYFRMK